MSLRKLFIVLVLVGGLTGGAGARAASADVDANAYDWKTWNRFWSFQPIHKPAPPAVRGPDWVKNPIDAYVLARLEARHLTPAPAADRATLIRRLSFDLTGLPPTPAEVREFLADTSADAWPKRVDRFLASPHYGEHWGRHWLDVARYVPGRIAFAGTKNASGDQPYRDYVVRAFNTDKPYGRFVTEQLAGDLLPPEADRAAELDRITAPAFLSIGAWFDQCTDPNRLQLEIIDDQINTTSKAFLGLSVSCARCHDHKFDPIPTSDYYALAGIFDSTQIIGDFSQYWRDGRTRQLRPLATVDEVRANDQLRARIDLKKADLHALLRSRRDALLKDGSADEPRYRAAAAQVVATAHPFTRRFEAEDFDGIENLRVGELKGATRDGHPEQVIETRVAAEQYVRYKFEVPETGQYQLEALYSADERTPVTLQVNGLPAVKEALADPTGGWGVENQRWAVIGPFDLHEGLNFLRLAAKDSPFPRIDRFRVYRVDDSTGAILRTVAQAEHLDSRLLADFVFDPVSPWPTIADAEQFLDAADAARAAAIRREIAGLTASVVAYPVTIAVTDRPTPADMPVHPRGGVYAVSKTPNPRGAAAARRRFAPPRHPRRPQRAA